MRSVDVDVMRNTNHFAKLKYKSHSNTHARAVRQASRQAHVTIDRNNHTCAMVSMRTHFGSGHEPVAAMTWLSGLTAKNFILTNKATV